MPTPYHPFYICSDQNNPGHNTLNAIAPCPTNESETAERRARHLVLCQELIQTGMQLSRIAAADVLEAHEQAKTPDAPRPNSAPRTDPNLNYHRHANGVRQAMTLENRVANNTFARPTPPAGSKPTSAKPFPLEDFLRANPDFFDDEEPPPYNPLDRGNLYEAVGNLSLTHPNRAEIAETLTDTIAETLTAYPTDHLSANFERICQAYGIAPDRHQLLPHLESMLRPPADAPDRYPK